ncbi:SRPBCC family protein [Marinobacter sp.]|uniref:SRPBCC family protein n=1 Tax=Marinobacter sp. TaxID=50741 RepID=UPI00384AB9C6
MFRIHVERTLDKDIDTVFEAITDHAHYDRFPGVDTSLLIEQGNQEPNGTGALRIIGAGPMKLTERITRYESPTVMHYRIEKSSPFPIAHDRGEILLKAQDTRTHVTWISEGHIRIPLIGRVLDKVVEKRFSKAFSSLLKAIERV